MSHGLRGLRRFPGGWRHSPGSEGLFVKDTRACIAESIGRVVALVDHLLILGPNKD